nr:hypothetical protein [uncultured Carboxylicivirga sp.]
MKPIQALIHWIEKADNHDRHLNKRKRIRKWSLILGGIGLLFGLSFIETGNMSIVHHALPDQENNQLQITDSIPMKSNPFELPTDSFEQLLKQHIHEKSAD